MKKNSKLTTKQIIRNSFFTFLLFLFISETFTKEFYGCGVNSYNVLSKDTSGDLLNPKMMDTSDILSIYASDTNSYILNNNGTIFGVGKNFKGQLGDGTFTPKPILTQANIAGPVKKFSAGVYSSFALAGKGEVYAFGTNDKGQLGIGSTIQQHTPTKIPSLSNIIEIAAGGEHTLVLHQNGTVFTFGSNNKGQLGDGSYVDKLVPVSIYSNISLIAAGFSHSIIVQNYGQIVNNYFTFGSNEFGEAGTSTTAGTSFNIPRAHFLLYEIIEQVSAGSGFTMILCKSGKVFVFGKNDKGQIGLPGFGSVMAPNLQTLLSNVSQISCGFDHSLVLLKNGSVLAFGANNFGQLGDGTKMDKQTPILIPSLMDIIQVAAGKLISIVLAKDGFAYSFGSNEFSQLGRRYITFRKLSDGPSNIKQQIFGPDFSFALTNDSRLWGVGNNENGQLGDGTKISKKELTFNYHFIGNFTPSSVSVGLDFTLVLTKMGIVFSFGGNNFGQLGDGSSSTVRLDPLSIQFGGAVISQISCGNYHSIALDIFGNIFTFGKNSNGQLGDGTTFSRLSPTQIALANGRFENFTQVSAGVDYTLGLSLKGDVYGFGKNQFYQLGLDNGATDALTPTIITNITNIIQIAAGNTHSLVLDKDGRVFGFGTNYNSEIGFGFPNQVTKPTQLNATKIKQILARDRSSLLLDEFGAIYGLGSNEFGKLCDGEFEDLKYPTRIQSSFTFSSIEKVSPSTLLSSFSIALSCFGLSSTDPLVCSGNGNCNSTDVCVCKTGFFGKNCHQITSINPTCFGIKSTELSVCSSYGNCLNTDQCSCYVGYSGYECEETTCFGVLSSQPSVCSSHGICTAPDRCLCENGFTGNNCSTNATDTSLIIPDCVVFNNNYLTYYKKEMKYFIEANICSSKSGWGGISFHQQNGISTASFIIVSWIQDGFTYFRELKYHSNDGINKFQEFKTLGIKLPKDQTFAQNELNDKQKFGIEIDEALLKKYDYITIACNSNPISSNFSFSYHQTLKTVYYNVTSSSRSVCDETVLSGFSKRISDTNSTVWVFEMSFYIVFFFIVFLFHNSQPLASRGIVPYVSIISQYGASFTSFQHFFFYLDWRSKYSCYLHSLLFENMLSLIFLLMPLNYLRFVLLANVNKEKTHISESSTKSLYFKFIVLLKYLSKPMLILWISIGFLIISSLLDLAVIFVIPKHLQCTTLKSYIIYGIHLTFNLFFGILLFAILILDVILSIVNFFREYSVVKKIKKCAFCSTILSSFQNFLYKNDPFLFRVEQVFAFIILLFYVALEISSFNAIFGENRFNYYIGQYLNIYGRSIITYSFIVYQAFIPFFMTLIFKLVHAIKKLLKLTKRKKLHLDYCLENEECFNLLFQFATEEWANENLLAWRSIEKFKKATGEKKRNIAFDIYYLYLNGDISPLEINIDSKNCKKVFSVINDENVELDNETFDDVEKALKINLSDTYSRFVFTTPYSNFEKNSEFKDNELNEIGFSKLE
jgi:alpha-tubulin suppressor-like RCC1 family protein